MGIFDNLFGNRQDYKLPESPYTNVGEAIAEAQRKEQENSPIFQVGTTEDGRVTLRMGNFGIWATMTDRGVDQLIGMLQAAKGLSAEITDDEDEE